MNVHANARLSPLGRQLLCERIRLEGWTVAEAAEAVNVSERTTYRWLARYDLGEPMTDRSSRPHHSPARTPPKVEAVIERLRRLRKTSSAIAALLNMAVSTVCAVLRRLGLNRLSRLGPPEPPNRYCRRHPGELVHLDVKKLGRFAKPGKRVRGEGPGRRSRGAGWEAVHVAGRRHQPPRLRRDPAGRDRPGHRRLLAPRGRLVRRPRHRHQGAADRQRRPTAPPCGPTTAPGTG
jgi:transposase